MGVTWSRRLPITRTESLIGGVLLGLAMLELFFSDEQPHPTTLDAFLMAAVPPIAVMFSRRHAEAAAATVAACMLMAAVADTPGGVLGSGLSWMVLTFALAAWSTHPGPWLAVLAGATVVRDLRTGGFDAADVMVDWVFLAMAGGAGWVVRRRARQAEALGGKLQLAEADRAARVADAVSHERALIARELHDIVAHAVSLMVVQASTARPLADRRDPELAGVLATIETAGREALTELRNLLGVLRAPEPAGLQPVPGVAQLDELVDGFRNAELDVHADLHVPEATSPGVALCIYRSVQEGLTNALRYAEGSRVEVSVRDDGGCVRIRIQDHGGVSAHSSLGSGTGLVGLRERVLLCGGTLAAGHAGPGYLLQVDLPADQGLPTGVLS